MMKETIAGDIRRIRKALIEESDMKVSVSYPFLLQMFESIETKAKMMADENEELKKLLKEEADYRCSSGECLSFRNGKCHSTYSCPVKKLRIGMPAGIDIWKKN